LVLSSPAFLLKVVPAGVLKGEDGLVDNVALGLTVSSKCRPLVVANVAGTEGLFERVFEALLRCSSVTVASGEFAVQCCLGEAVVLILVISSCSRISMLVT
jgi:hypothetical protein